MARLRQFISFSWVNCTIWGLGVLVFIMARARWPVRELEATGPTALRDLAFTLLLWLLILILSTSLGSVLLRKFRFENLDEPLRMAYAFALGFGVITLWITTLALLSALNLFALKLSISVVAGCVAPETNKLLKRLGGYPSSMLRSWREAPNIVRVILCLSLFIAATSFVNALSPAWDYDGLMYHLLGPRLFLEAGKIIPYTDNWYINAPFNIEMVFSIGLVFGDDMFPKLIHFTLGALYILAGFLLARRLLNGNAAWLSTALILGIPTLPILAGFAYIDLGWSAFEVLALLAFMIWFQDKDQRWLLLSGLMCGLAMGSKYLGLMGFGLLGLVIVTIDLRSSWRELISTILVFSVPAVLVACPWYLKNLIWFKNPVFPLYFGGPGWPEWRLELYDSYLRSFGHGRSFLDTILLPLNLFIRNTQFGAVMNRIEIPNPLFLFVLIFPFLRKDRYLNTLGMISGGRFVLWAIGSQQTRFLMPIFPLISILTVYVLWGLFSRRERFNYIPGILCAAFMGITLFYQIIYTTVNQPFGVLLGVESRESYLLRMVNTYPGIAYARDNLPEEGQMLLLGDGRGYYCVPQCIPDPDHFRWSGEIASLVSYDNLGVWFSMNHVHYLAVSLEDLDFLIQHDPHGVIEQAVARLSMWRDDGCLEEIFSTEWISIFKIKCKQ